MVVVDPVRRVVALLVAAYPEARLDPATPDLYVRALADLEPNDLEEAVMTLVATRRRFPTVAELRETVIERRLALPSAYSAWEEVSAYVYEPEGWDDCGCDDGYTDRAADEVCPRCRGEARIETRRRGRYEALSEPARRALRAVGGRAAIAEHDELSVIRGQFVKAYETFRREVVIEENLGSAGLALTRQETPALTEGRSR